MWSIDRLARFILSLCRHIEQADGKEMMEICSTYYDPMQVEDYVMLN